MWTEFWDMHSGGERKLDAAHILIEASEADAVKIFAARFGRDPHNVTCECCGPDYSLTEHGSVDWDVERLIVNRSQDSSLLIYADGREETLGAS